MDFRRNSGDHPPLTIDSLTVERGSSTKFLGVHIKEDLTRTTNTTSLSKKAQQRLNFLRRLKRASLPPPILTTFYRGTIESVLTSCITVWYWNCSAADHKTLQRTVNTAEKIINAPPPPPSWTFFLHDAPVKLPVSWKTPPIPPHSPLPAPTIRKTVPEHQSPLRQTAQQLFPPGCKSPELNSHRHSLKPYKPLPPVTRTDPPPQKNTVWDIFCAIRSVLNRWVGLYKPPVVTHYCVYIIPQKTQ